MDYKKLGMLIGGVAVTAAAYHFLFRKNQPMGALAMNPGNMGALAMNPGNMGAIAFNGAHDMGALAMSGAHDMGAVHTAGFGAVALSGHGAGAAF